MTHAKNTFTAREAVELVSAAFKIPREQAIAAICRRARRVMIVALAERAIGFSPPTIPRMPSDWDNQIIWPWFFGEPFMADPGNSLWSTGDFEVFWSGYGPDGLFLKNVRFIRDGLVEMLSQSSEGDNDNDKPLPPVKPTEIGRLSASPAPKWDWESVLAELIALAAAPDGLEVIHGFSMPRNGQAPRGSQARVEEWMVAAFERRNGPDNVPSPSEIRTRAKTVIEALIRASNG